jgi:peptide deformylase
VIRPILHLGDAILRQHAALVTDVDEVRQLAADLTHTMRSVGGLGLAANQVGVAKRVCVIEGASRDGKQPTAITLINPELLEWSGKQDGWESCLSIPGSRVRVRRARRIVVQALDLAGERRRYIAEKFEARTMQHEIDHLSGILIIDQSSKLRLQHGGTRGR